MKFPRNAKLLRSPFDVAPFAAVFFLLVIFLLLAALLPKPGLSLELPKFNVSDQASGLPGTDKPSVAVAVDSSGRFYFENGIVTETALNSALKSAAENSREPLTLVIHADKTVTYEQLVRLTLLARNAKIQNVLLATLPRIVNTPDLP